MEQAAIIFFASLGATLVSSSSGGGASALSLPVFLWAGVPLPVAIAALKVCGIFWTPVSARRYLAGKRTEWGFLALFAGVGLIGAFISVQLVTRIDPAVLEPAIGVLILALVLYTLRHKDLGVVSGPPAAGRSRPLTYPLAGIMGFYEGILGSGNGIVFAVFTCRRRGYDLHTALGHYFAVAFVWVLFASLLYVHKGFFDPAVIAAAILGSVIGGYAGAGLARTRGNRFSRIIFISFGFLLALKLIIGF
jgi:hypothetical protein